MVRAVVIGAGIGGLSTAAVLAKHGVDVTVLEAHIYPGGCAGTFYHQGYRFDAGATLAGGVYPGGPMHIVAQTVGINAWPARAANPAMAVHLPDGTAVTRWTDDRRWAERRQAFGQLAEPFWHWQERTADALWDLALRHPAWPPQTLAESLQLARHGLSWLRADWRHRLNLHLLADMCQPLAKRLESTQPNPNLKLFIDAQLLIAAQTTSAYANALYGATALDLPRRGVVHFENGMGAIAETLVQAVRQYGGQVHYRQAANRIRLEHQRPVAVDTQHRQRTESFPADIVIANLSPWNIAPLLNDTLPRPLQDLPNRPQDGWGAFMVYVGLDKTTVPEHAPLHHQVVVQEPLAEGTSVFLSLSPAWDDSRAPVGQCAMTLSTHTEFTPWWQLFEHDRAAYESRKAMYVDQILAAAERVIPKLRDAAALILPGTPITFHRYTRRAWGWVGGFPQTHLLRAWGPRLSPDLWMVGDSIFPGQSTAAVALGGMRVAQAILGQLGIKTESYIDV
jgi:C-3',4' desaturase CrtD